MLTKPRSSPQACDLRHYAIHLVVVMPLLPALLNQFIKHGSSCLWRARESTASSKVRRVTMGSNEQDGPE